MTQWECKELVYELKSPLHIGTGQNLGIINRTRYYVPGKTMWGAFVANIGRKKGLNSDKDWKKLGKFVENNMIFTYFYVYDKENNFVFRPMYKKSGLVYGNISKNKFESKYISSFASAAVEKNSGTASDGDLHEIELIKDNTSPGNSVYLKGYVFLNNKSFNENEDYDKEIFLESIGKLQIGGERNYGYGKVLLDKNEETKEVFGFKVIENSKSIRLNNFIFGHLINSFDYINEFNGDIEPLVGYEFGGNTNYSGVGLIPGSKVNLNKNTEIMKYGLLKLKND